VAETTEGSAEVLPDLLRTRGGTTLLTAPDAGRRFLILSGTEAANSMQGAQENIMKNILQTIMQDYLDTHPKPGEPPEIYLTVPTHDPDRDTSKFRVSDAGKCRLMRYWKRQGKPASNAMPFEWRVQAEAGNMLHAWIQYIVKQSGNCIDAEAELVDEHRIGHFDLMLKHPYGTETYLYDIKTISNKKAYYMAKYGNGVDEHHQFQLITYFLMLPPGIDKLRIAYVTRDTLDITEFPVLVDEMKDRVEEDWDILITAWENQEPPRANAQKWECTGCQFHDVCDMALA
jgi:CRISPR/Cas system-associated exonuclease Cas4 (RecB family)